MQAVDSIWKFVVIEIIFKTINLEPDNLFKQDLDKMKIGVISDTHISKPTKKLEQLASDLFADVDMILHAGDLISLEILDAFMDKKVIAVCGNMDYRDVSARLAATEIIRVQNYRIGLTHGWGAKDGLEERIIQSFDNVDAIVYGHSHVAVNHIKDGILMFNPGAFSGSFPSGKNPSVGLLYVDTEIKGTIIPLNPEPLNPEPLNL